MAMSFLDNKKRSGRALNLEIGETVADQSFSRCESFHLSPEKTAIRFQISCQIGFAYIHRIIESLVAGFTQLLVVDLKW